jgi:DNA-binding transcriptional LysR family regulator
VGDVEMISVAAPHHPLARSHPVPAGAARHHRQLVLTVRTPFLEGPDIGVFATEEWRMADLGAKHALLLAGVGWGNMPEPNVRDDLAAGRLVRLELPEAKSGLYSFQAMYRTDQPPGPAAAWLIQRFADQARRAERV